MCTWSGPSAAVVRLFASIAKLWLLEPLRRVCRYVHANAGQQASDAHANECARAVASALSQRGLACAPPGPARGVPQGGPLQAVVDELDMELGVQPYRHVGTATAEVAQRPCRRAFAPAERCPEAAIDPGAQGSFCRASSAKGRGVRISGTLEGSLAAMGTRTSPSAEFGSCCVPALDRWNEQECVQLQGTPLRRAFEPHRPAARAGPGHPRTRGRRDGAGEGSSRSLIIRLRRHFHAQCYNLVGVSESGRRGQGWLSPRTARLWRRRTETELISEAINCMTPSPTMLLDRARKCDGGVVERSVSRPACFSDDSWMTTSVRCSNGTCQLVTPPFRHELTPRFPALFYRSLFVTLLRASSYSPYLRPSLLRHAHNSSRAHCPVHRTIFAVSAFWTVLEHDHACVWCVCVSLASVRPFICLWTFVPQHRHICGAHTLLVDCSQQEKRGRQSGARRGLGSSVRSPARALAHGSEADHCRLNISVKPGSQPPPALRDLSRDGQRCPDDESARRPTLDGTCAHH